MHTTPIKMPHNTSVDSNQSTVRVWAILSDILPPLPPKTMSLHATCTEYINIEKQKKPRMVFKTLKQNQNTKEEMDVVRMRLLDQKATSLFTLYIVNKTEHLPISHNLVYNMTLKVSARKYKSDINNNDGDKKKDKTETPKPNQKKVPHNKQNGQRIRRRGSSNRHPVFDMHGTISVISSSATNESGGGTKNYEYASLITVNSCGNDEALFYPLIVSRMIKNEKHTIPSTQIARAAITEILLNTFISIRCGLFSEQSVLKSAVTDKDIQDLENNYGIPLEITSCPITTLTLCKPKYALFNCGSLMDHHSNQCEQIFDWIKLGLKSTNPKDITIMIKNKNTCGILCHLVTEELENAEDLDIVFAMLANWFKNFKPMDQRLGELTKQPRLNIPWFNATLGHTRRARMIFDCAQKHPLLFVQFEVLFIKQQTATQVGTLVEKQDTIIRDDPTSFYTISLLEWLPHIKHDGFVMKDIYFTIPFFTSTLSVLSCLNNLRSVLSNDEDKRKNKVQDLLLSEALNIGVRFAKQLFSANSDIAYKLPSTIRFNEQRNTQSSAPSSETDVLFKGSHILDIAIEILLTTPPLDYCYIRDVVSANANSNSNTSPSLSSYGIPSKVYGINNQRSMDNLFLLKSPSDMEWFNLPPIVKTVNEYIPGVTYYQPREQYIAKSTIMSHVHSLYSRASDRPKYEHGYTMENSILTKEQQIALNSIDTTPITMIVGGPGVGKTFVAKEIFKKYGYSQTRLMAYTGALVSHLRSVISTGLKDADAALHTLDITDVVHMVHEQYIRRFKSPTQFYHSTTPIRVVIIDEVPMFDNRTFAMALSLYAETQTRLVFLADENQIGSIGLGTVFKQFKEYYEEQRQQENTTFSYTIEENTERKKTQTTTPLMNMCTLTENFRQSCSLSKDLKELATLYDRGSSRLLFGFNQIDEETSLSGGVHFIKLSTTSEPASITEVVPKFFFKDAQDPSHLIDTMFLAFTRTTRSQVNAVVSSVLLRALIPEAVVPTQATYLNSTNNGHNTENTSVYFVGQRVMVEGKNFHGKHIHPSLHLFNGEVYTVSELFALPPPETNKKEDTKEKNEKQKSKLPIIQELERVINNTLSYNYAIKEVGSSYFKLIDTKKKEGSIIAESFIVKLQGWPISNTRSCKYVIITSRPSYSLSPLPLLNQPLFNSCPILGKHQLVESWAMTVNKAQGCEFKKVCLVILNGTEETKHFSTGHGLVAISRAKEDFTLIANSPDALDRMKNPAESGNVFTQKQNIEAISDLKTHLLSPKAPWINHSIENSDTSTQINPRGLKRSRSTNM